VSHVLSHARDSQTLTAPLPSSDDLALLLHQEFKPQTVRARADVESAVRALARAALSSQAPLSADAVESIEAIIAEIDRKLSEQINLILHHPELQRLEAAWRGLHYLVTNTETDSLLKIRVMNMTKSELHRTLKRFKGVAWDQSPIFKKLYEEEYGQLGGEPYGCLVADYYFDHSSPDVETLSELSKTAAACHCPVITSPAPSLFQMESWHELANPRDIVNVFGTPEYAAWRSLRDAEESRYLGMALPRFLARRPYGQHGEPVPEFDFEEDSAGADASRYTWANAAYAMAANITRSYKAFGWCSRIRGIESGGAVSGLPTHSFPTDDGGIDLTCPTEITITDRREAELAKAGFMALVHKKNSDLAAFIGAQSLHRPAQYDDPDATANAALAARLPYLFATCRFAHYLKCIVRDKVGSFKGPEDMQRWLQNWLTQYVEGDPAHASEEAKARKPLADAEVIVEEDPLNPGYYKSNFFLRPHYQLEGLTVSLRLVSKLPSARISA
jgi:type VI secretion system protein ImpC